jgi:hypothetical protein
MKDECHGRNLATEWAPMKVLGIDFTSKPSHRKPITSLNCILHDGVLEAGTLESWTSFAEFEQALARPGPWIAGLDFPFGQARRFIDTIGWPLSWDGYVRHAASLGRQGFRDALTRYREARAIGDREHRRATDIAAGAVSPQKLYGVPVGLMFFEGAQRLLASPASIPHLKRGDPERIVVEAYPGVLARAHIGRRSYKSDAKQKQTTEQHKARVDLFARLIDEAPSRYGLAIRAPASLCEHPGADHLDALLCALQAAWAYNRRGARYGATVDVDALEGWIANPCLPPE